MEAKQLVQEIADEDGVISPSVPTETEPEVEIDFDINIRNDDLQLFETDSGRQLIQTPEMDESVFVEPVPSENGFTAEVVVNPSVEFVPTDTADVAQHPTPKSASSTKIRID